MGLFDRLFGKKGAKRPRREDPPHADSASDKTAAFEKDHQPDFSEQPSEPLQKTALAATEASVVPLAAVSEPPPPEPPALESVLPDGAGDAPATEDAAPPAPPLAESVAVAVPIAEAEPPLSPSSEPASVCPEPSWDTRVQKRLDTYFARLRELYP